MAAELHKLEEKYWQGKTTLEEEALLKRAAADGLDGLSETLQIVLDDAGTECTRELDADFDVAFWQKVEERGAKRGGMILPLTLWMRYAAAAVVLIAVTSGSFYFFQNDYAPSNTVAVTESSDTYEDPEVALKQAIEALNFASEKLNAGQKPAGEIKRFHQSKLTITGGISPSKKNESTH